MTFNDSFVDINCTASGVPSKYTFSTWRHTWPGLNEDIRNELRSTYNTSSERTLRLVNLTYQDTGFYTCAASNGVKDLMMDGSVFLLVKCEY